jgi:predicted nucleotidyltransferase
MITLKNCSESDIQELLPPNVILLGYRGSIAHGMYLDPDHPESVDDKDIMGVCFGARETYLGLEAFEQRQVQLREWDSVCYEIRKYVRLLENGNPNVLSLLWLEDHHYIYRDAWGYKLIAHRDLFNSKRIYHSFIGYAYGQVKKMEHASVNGYMGSKRKALVEKYGYDCKNAAHAIRLLRMGVEFLKEGEFHVFRKDARQLVDIKTGKWTLDQVKKEAEHQFRRIESAYDDCKLPKTPDRKKINELVMEITWMWLNSRPIDGRGSRVSERSS